MPRQGLAIDISTLAGSEGVVTTIDDFFFESFSAGEMHPILTTSRTNLITYSEDISNADWSKSLVTAASSIASPVSSNSFLIEETSYSSAVPGLQLAAGISVSAGTYTGSFYVKKNNLRYLGIVLGASAQRIRTNFDFNTETFKTPLLTGQTTGAVSFEKDGDFYRISVKATFPSTVAAVFSLHPLATDTYPFFAFQDSDNRSFHVSGFQLEQDSFASAYIPTSGSAVTVSTTLNDTSEVWDFDGTDIMIAEDPEDEGFWEEGSNLVLNHNFGDLGSELITNGDFSTAGTITSSSYSLGWTSPDSGLSISSGVLNIVRTSSGGRAYASNGSSGNLTITNGKTYQLTYTITENSDNSTLQYHNGGAYVNTSNSAPGTYTVTYVAAGTIFLLRNGGSNDTTIKIDNVILKQVDPNDRWSLGTGWTISDGKAHADVSSTAALSQTISTGAGNTYEVTFTISNFTTGVLQPQLDGILATPTQINSNGTHTVKITAAGSSHGLLLYAIGTSEFSIDNVTIKEYAIKPKDI
jgi:hypothetical protein